MVSAAEEEVEARWAAGEADPSPACRAESVQDGDEEAFKVAAALGLQSVLQSDVVLLQVHVLHRLQVQLLVGGRVSLSSAITGRTQTDCLSKR